MKVALLHYWLTNIRGGEKVFFEICKLFPDADIYTHVIADDIKEQLPPHKRIFTSYISKLPNAVRNYKHYMPLMFHATRQFDLSAYDLIISSESGPIKGIDKPKHTKHICYCHTPPRYIWDMFDEYYKNGSFIQKAGMKLLKNYLRDQDKQSAESVDQFIVNSKFVGERVQRIYGRDSTVIYPPVDVEFYSQPSEKINDIYYLFVGELTKYKRADLAVEAFNENGKKLIIVGDGEERDKLKQQARQNITFVGRVDNFELRKLYQNAQALIFPGIEDFGIVPVEAMAAGTPVIAYCKGGAIETVIENTTGDLFTAQTATALNTSLQKLRQPMELIQNHHVIESYSKNHFHTAISSFVTHKGFKR